MTAIYLRLGGGPHASATTFMVTALVIGDPLFETGDSSGTPGGRLAERGGSSRRSALRPRLRLASQGAARVGTGNPQPHGLRATVRSGRVTLSVRRPRRLRSRLARQDHVTPTVKSPGHARVHVWSRPFPPCGRQAPREGPGVRRRRSLRSPSGPVREPLRGGSGSYRPDSGCQPAPWMSRPGAPLVRV